MAYRNEKEKKISNSINENYPIKLNDDFFKKFRFKNSKVEKIKSILKENLDDEYELEKKYIKGKNITNMKAVKSYYGEKPMRINGQGLNILVSLCATEKNNRGWFGDHQYRKTFKDIYNQLGYAVVNAGEKMFMMTEELKDKEFNKFCFGKNHHARDRNNRGFYNDLLINDFTDIDEDDLIAKEYDDDNDKGLITEQSVDKADCDDCNGLSLDLKSLKVSEDLSEDI